MSQGYTSYSFTTSVGIDYNYDPSSSTRDTPSFDPYTDTIPEPINDEPELPVHWRRRDDDGHPALTTKAVVVDDDSWLEPIRAPIPEPIPTPIPTAPTESYILESQQTSERLPSPSVGRKLLILDLNGTLVYRTPHARREFRGGPRRRGRGQGHNHGHNHNHTHNQGPNQNQYQAYAHGGVDEAPPHSYGQPSQHEQYNAPSSTDPTDPYADPTAPRGLRNAYPRAYMPSFQSYLLHPTTLTWLDTMVWSSAQPHSVADMVARCFGARAGELRAVWARDTLGLEEGAYRAYSFPTLTYPDPLTCYFVYMLVDRKTQTTKDLARPWAQIQPSSSSSQKEHSARTTLLLDDSPRKAHLQPWNHLCIREYSGALRAADLQCRAREEKLLRSPIPSSPTIPSHPASHPSSPPHTSTATLIHPRRPSTAPSASPFLEPNLEPSPDETPSSPPPKKRKRPKKSSLLPPASPPADELGLGLGGYDPTLLAVIGVLESVKWEGNVAGWVRGGGLLPAPVGEASTQTQDDGVQVGDIPGQAIQRKARALGEVDSTSIDSIASEAQDGKRRRVLSDSPPPDTPPTPAPPSASPTPTLTATLPPFHAATTNEGTASQENSIDTPAADLGDTGQWFSDLAALRHWVRAGVRALGELGIVVEAGVLANA
ncbi:hypothetical protein DXG01_003402 [Tephrocybe rancida]|nr:hypothetical protein DXG01_003402 [Tephrocybe rancida]